MLKIYLCTNGDEDDLRWIKKISEKIINEDNSTPICPDINDSNDHFKKNVYRAELMDMCDFIYVFGPVSGQKELDINYWMNTKGGHVDSIKYFKKR